MLLSSTRQRTSLWGQNSHLSRVPPAGTRAGDNTGEASTLPVHFRYLGSPVAANLPLHMTFFSFPLPLIYCPIMQCLHNKIILYVTCVKRSNLDWAFFRDGLCKCTGEALGGHTCDQHPVLHFLPQPHHFSLPVFGRGWLDFPQWTCVPQRAL